MARIDVNRIGGDTFRVEVHEGGSSSSHEVTASADDVRRYGGDAGAEKLIEASFNFLLEREPKESILSRFDLPVIEHYFPEYPRKIRGKLD
ncbi:MAG: hypothetical protein GTN89_14610 [Acidobacteria bacterium]|nr:hypothetical protein [Acidobacteriota bacterium]NIM62393.1 hypothetical protein [Acidobacteriota bacterium]NIO58262.1 hypothetical protein [Acidobacteriota bacterium]NIQ31564.1 hypothetical protein [Acidobacteriota bacterium]NIQ83892.1 hypothetical protein [Acidobacteriota bacterium]